MKIVLFYAAISSCQVTVDSCLDRSDADRLACFDALVSEHCTLAAEEERRTSSFGLNAQLERKQQDESAERKESREKKELVDVVDQIVLSTSGMSVVLKDSQQRWRQVDDTRLRLKPGDEIKIRGGFGGSFYLTKAKGSRSVKVRRIQ